MSTPRDPAIEAAFSAAEKLDAGLIPEGVPWPHLAAAAREMAAPLKKWALNNSDALKAAGLLESLTPLLYPTEGESGD